MALPASCLSEDQFTCSICLDMFNNPVSTPCGHSFCQSCLCSYWDGGAGRGAGGRGAKPYQCPLCKESFRRRPELHINRTLKEITEQFKEMAKSTPLPDGGVGGAEHLGSHHLPALSTAARSGDLTDSLLAEMISRFQQMPPGVPQATVPHPGVPQSPNVHVAFQAQNNEHHHPPPPYSPPRRFSVSGATDFSPSLPLCPTHLRGLEFFCRSDNICVCSVCVETAAHRGHIVVPAKREWDIKKSQLGIAEVELKDLICERERKIEEIHTSIREIKAAAEKETDGVVCAFSKLISSVERCQAEMLELIEMTLRTAEHRAQTLLNELKDDIAALQNRSTTLNQLAASEDYILFLKTFPLLSTVPQAKDWSGVSVSSQLTSGVVLTSVNQAMVCLEEEMQKLPKICKQSLSTQSALGPNPKVRRVQEYAADITLDPSTAHPRLVISAGGKQVHCRDRHQVLPDNPERFNRVVCVMAQQGFSSGRHYWEVEVGGKTDWDLGVASHSINRKGKITVSPSHGFWFISLRNQTNYSFRTEPSTNLTVNRRPSRVGIYVDCDKGLVSFYNVEAKVLIYTFTDKFPDAIHPFFSPCTNKSGQNKAPLVICPVSATE